jgi:hypothetical protein
MSLLGKILAILNIFGALALVYTGTMAYSKRHSGAYAVQLVDFILNGLPADESERTPQGRPVHELIKDSPNFKKDIFEPGMPPVTTQRAEVESVITDYQKAASAETDPQKRMVYQSRILMPFLDDSVEREWAISTRLHLASPRSVALLRALYDEALRQAILAQDHNEPFLAKAPGIAERLEREPEQAKKLAATWERALFEGAFRRSLKGAALEDLQDFRELRQFPDLVSKDEFKEFKALRGRRRPSEPMLHDRAIDRALTELAKTDASLKEDAARKQLSDAFKFQVSQSSNPFTLGFLSALPEAKVKELVADQAAIRATEDAPEKKKAAEDKFAAAYKPAFDQAFASAIESHRSWLDARFNRVFDDTKPKQGTRDGEPINVYTEGQRRAIARLLVRSAILRAEDEVTTAGSPADKAALQKGLPEKLPPGTSLGLPPYSAQYLANLGKTTAYGKYLRRAQAVVGLKAALTAVTERANALQQMPQAVMRQHAIEESEYVAANQALLEQARSLSRQLDADMALLEREKFMTAQQESVLNRRRADIGLYENDLREEQKQTAEVFRQLEARAREVFDARLRLRDYEVNNLKALRRIEKREGQVRELEKDALSAER